MIKVLIGIALGLAILHRIMIWMNLGDWLDWLFFFLDVELFLLVFIIVFIIIGLIDMYLQGWRAERRLKDPDYVTKLPIFIDKKKDIKFLLKMFGEMPFVSKQKFRIKKRLQPYERLFFILAVNVFEFGKTTSSTNSKGGIIFLSENRLAFEEDTFLVKSEKEGIFIECELKDIRTIDIHIDTTLTYGEHVRRVEFSVLKNKVAFEIEVPGIIGDKIKDLFVQAVQNLVIDVKIKTHK